MATPGKESFEDLPIWQKCLELAQDVHDIASGLDAQTMASLRQRMEDKAIQICGHIAEGYEHGDHRQLLINLQYARGYAAALRSHLRLAARQIQQGDLPARIKAATQVCQECGEEISEWTTKLQKAETRSFLPPVSGVPILPPSG